MIIAPSQAETTSEAQRINAWLDETALKVIDRLKNRITQFNEPQGGVSTATAEQKSKFSVIAKMLAEHDMHTKERRSYLMRMIKGFLVEFTRQSERGITPCNVENNKNPEAKAFWESQSPEAFEEAKYGGILHSATSYLGLKQRFPRSVTRNTSFPVLGEIIRSSIDVFNEEYPKFAPDTKPQPSIYNAPDAIVRKAWLLDNIVPKSRSR